MTFNSLAYLLLLGGTLLLFAGLPPRARLALLIGANVLFYAYWSLPFLSLILISAGVDFAMGAAIHRAAGRRDLQRIFLALSVAVNLGILGYFKYAGFFVENVTALLGDTREAYWAAVLLPPGISFYTFQSMSYTIDIYRGLIPPTRSFTRFFLFVSFFPQLVAGPIERAGRLLPQFDRIIHLRPAAGNIAPGLRLIVWGLFKKIMIADYCALLVNAYYADPGAHDGGAALVAMYAFYIQLYCDFSAYTDIARGSARLFGISLVKNFDQPLLATNMADFWRRWHISLFTWFRDYVYIPLGGNRGGLARTARNLLLTALVSGLWHGAAWTFVVWGLYHGVLLTLTVLAFRAGWRARLALRAGRLAPFLGFLLQFNLSAAGFVIFRAATLEDAWHAFTAIAAAAANGLPLLPAQAAFLAGVALFLGLSYGARRGQWLERIDAQPALAACFYTGLVLLMTIFGNLDAEPFIYFQF